MWTFGVGTDDNAIPPVYAESIGTMSFPLPLRAVRCPPVTPTAFPCLNVKVDKRGT